jgi:acyl-CoA synthetase (AMP-forming)/AMP-acid ligase II
MLLDLDVGNLTEPVTGRRWDRQQIARQITARTRCYQLEGLAAGDRVFLHLGNQLEFFADLLAIWRQGGCVVPIDSRLTAFEVENLVKTATPRFSVVDDKTDPAIVERVTSANVKVLNTLQMEGCAGSTLDPHVVGGRARMDDDALILFTSGSTGSPKGVVHTHRSLRARWIALQQSLGLEAYRRTLCLLPTHFGHGLICNCLFPWLSGQDLFITPPFKPELIMRLGALIDEHEITFLSSVPSVWRLALKVARPPAKKTLLRIHCGSAPLSAYLWNEIAAWSSTKQVFNAYGITETGSWVAGTTMPDFTPEDGLIGEGWGAVIKILKTRGTEAPPAPEMECRPEEPGYVWLNTPALMKGYLSRDDLTEQVVCQGWFMTGDIGLLDQRGRLYLKGREREEINKGGMKVYPADIDAVVERFEGASDVCSFGFDDPLYGQNVGIAVALKDNSQQTIRQLHQWMKRHLAEHKMPVRWYVMESIPRTSRGKVNRDTVMQACAQLAPLELAKVLHADKKGSS